MRSVFFACSVLAALALTSCSSTQDEADATEGPLGTDQSAIAYGAADTAHPHTAVVALLGNAGGGSFDECSGTIVQVKNGQGYVLTAAHCCNMTVPSVVIMASDYGPYESYVVGGTPKAPAYAVTAGSVYYDALYNPNAQSPDHDFCMLKFAAPATAAVIPVAQPGQDGVAVGVSVEHVGYGVTDTTTSNSERRDATAKVDMAVTSLVMESSQGGAAHTPGVCEGDSGGPVLMPAGVAQNLQKVVGTVSYGDASSCVQNTVNVCMRVTSETGAGGFITNFLADTPSGTAGGSTTTGTTCTTCAQDSESGACSSQATACAKDAKCVTLNTCLGACTTTTCQSTCETAAGATAVNELNAFDTCVCETACTSECASECGTSSSSSTSTSTGGATTGTASTGSNTGSTGTASGGAGGASSGTAGVGGSASTGSSGSGSANQHSGCSISRGQGADPASPASLAGILLGAALAFSRRRR